VNSRFLIYVVHIYFHKMYLNKLLKKTISMTLFRPMNLGRLDFNWTPTLALIWKRELLVPCIFLSQDELSNCAITNWEKYSKIRHRLCKIALKLDSLIFMSIKLMLVNWTLTEQGYYFPSYHHQEKEKYVAKCLMLQNSSVPTEHSWWTFIKLFFQA
jgi:hypothetical protein